MKRFEIRVNDRTLFGFNTGAHRYLMPRFSRYTDFHGGGWGIYWLGLRIYGA